MWELLTKLMKEQILRSTVLLNVCSFDYLRNFITENQGRSALSKILPVDVNPGDFHAM